MSTAPDPHRMSLREYVLWEETSGGKHEFYRGEIFGMAGSTIPHNRISRNVIVGLTRQLEGRECEAFGSDLRIRINAVDLSTYPDVSVVCGEPKIDDVDRHAITNPRVIVEVLSKSTENYDRGRKFEFYQHLESFAEYVVVYQSEARIIHYVRQNDRAWRYRLLAGMSETLRLESIGCELSFDVIYRNVEFGSEVDEGAKSQPPSHQ
jgi:Uma2 family endonuclease